MIDDLEKEVDLQKKIIKDLYLSDQMPWIIGYSGGKDSTTCVHLVWMALREIPIQQRTKPIYVISTDTMVENPIVATWVARSLQKMKEKAASEEIPIIPTRLVPDLKNRFWVNLIGRGYPAPRPKFRWCTDRLKIQTATSFIQKISQMKGEAILVLGTRKAESSSRAKTIEKYSQSSRSLLSRHSDPKLARVWILAPIVDWDNDDVWEFIGSYENPWGVPNEELVALYRGATPDNECPVITDTSTQSCGGSRFGCFVCTMVSQDKSMQAMILNDESKSWMQPILDFRNKYLAPSPEEYKNREFIRKNGKALLIHDRLVRGPYTQEYRAFLLKKLLEIQNQINKLPQLPENEKPILITNEEIEEIRRIWVEENNEIDDLVPQICSRVDKELPDSHLKNDCGLNAEDFELLKQICTTWVEENDNLGTAEELKQRSQVLYKLARSLISNSCKSVFLKTRSEEIEHLATIISHNFLKDEAEAIAYAESNRAFDETAVEDSEAIEIEAEDIVKQSTSSETNTDGLLL